MWTRRWRRSLLFSACLWKDSRQIIRHSPTFLEFLLQTPYGASSEGNRALPQLPHAAVPPRVCGSTIIVPGDNPVDYQLFQSV